MQARADSVQELLCKDCGGGGGGGGGIVGGIGDIQLGVLIMVGRSGGTLLQGKFEFRPSEITSGAFSSTYIPSMTGLYY